MVIEIDDAGRAAVVAVAGGSSQQGSSRGVRFMMSMRYFAYSTARVSRMTVTLIWPG